MKRQTSVTSVNLASYPDSIRRVDHLASGNLLDIDKYTSPLCFGKWLLDPCKLQMTLDTHLYLETKPFIALVILSNDMLHGYV